MKQKILNAIENGKRAIAAVREYYPRARKAVIALVGALGLIVGTDAPLYQDVVAILVALGVWWAPNAE